MRGPVMKCGCARRHRRVGVTGAMGAGRLLHPLLGCLSLAFAEIAGFGWGIMAAWVYPPSQRPPFLPVSLKKQLI